MKKHELLEVPVSVLRQRFWEANLPVASSIIAALEADPRAGAQSLGRQLRIRQAQTEQELERLEKLLHFEKELWAQGVLHVAGVDEAGVAPLAGPIVAGAVILPQNYRLRGLDDSKKILKESKREALAHELKRDAVAWAAGWASVEEVDQLNIYHAGLLAMRRAVEGLNMSPSYCLVDARTIPDLRMPQKGIIHGDALSLSIAAASIIAKTTRDAHMNEMDAKYPGYGFAKHKGYPTPEHQETLMKLGAVDIHRRSFALVKEALGLSSSQETLFQDSSSFRKAANTLKSSKVVVS